MAKDKVQLSNEQVALIRDLCRERFKYFCQTMLAPKWYDENFHGELCDFLQDGIVGVEAPDRLVVMPRTHLKTTIAATLYPLWRAIVDPEVRAIVVCNTSPNAEKTVHSIKGMVEGNKTLQVLFPEIIPRFDKVRWSDRCACINRTNDYPEGTFEAAGVGSNIIRRHYDLIIEDDTVAPKKDELSGEELLPSREDIEKAIGFHKLTMPLLIDVTSGQRIVIGTRWAFYDLINHIKTEIAEHRSRFVAFDRAAVSDTGKPNYKRFTEAALQSIREDMGPYMYSALYLNSPLVGEQMKFRHEWTHYYEEEELPQDGTVTVTVDPADPPTGKSSQDFSVALSALSSKQGLYVRRYRRGRYTDAQLINHTLDLADQDYAQRIRIEVDRYPHLAAGFRIETAKRGKYYIIEEVKTRGKTKSDRIMRLQPVDENGLLRIRHGMDELESELYQFPMGKHDDIIDALAWQVMDNFQVPDFTQPSTPKEHRRGSTFDFNQIVKSTNPRQPSIYSMFGVPGIDASRWEGRPKDQKSGVRI